MGTEEPVRKRICFGVAENSEENIETKIENCYPFKCLCCIKSEDLKSYVDQNFEELSQNPNLVFLSFLTWLGQTFHDQLSSGFVCSEVQKTAAYVLGKTCELHQVFQLLSSSDESVQFSTVQCLTALLPLCHCGLESSSNISSTLVEKLLSELIGNNSASTHNPTSELDSLTVGEAAMLDDDDDMFGHYVPATTQAVTNDDMRYKSSLVSVLSGLVTHSDRSADDTGVTVTRSCHRTELDEDDMCQETQIKCMVFKIIEPVWTKFTQLLIRHLGSRHMNTDTEVFLCESFALWQNLISVRANLSFVESRGLSSDLATCLSQLGDTTPGPVWRSVLGAVSECLCYGTTLGLQSIPPQEPCNLAHTFIRWV